MASDVTILSGVIAGIFGIIASIIPVVLKRRSRDELARITRRELQQRDEFREHLMEELRIVLAENHRLREELKRRRDSL